MLPPEWLFFFPTFPDAKIELPVLSFDAFTILSPSSYPMNIYSPEKYLEGVKTRMDPIIQIRPPTSANDLGHSSGTLKVPIANPTTWPRGLVMLMTVIMRVFNDWIPN